MKTLLTMLLGLITLFLISCDPGKVLIIRADNKSNLSVTVYTNHKIIPFDNNDDSSKLIIRVPYNDTIVKTFNYGLGTWPNESIADLSTNIDSIVIVNSSGRLVLSTKSSIQAYLKKHRSGFAGSILTIEAK